MSTFIKREIPLIIGSLVIAFMWLDFFVVSDVTRNIANIIQDFAVVAIATATGLGVINIFQISRHRINKRGPYWYLDIWTLFLVVAMIGMGIIGEIGLHPSFQWTMRWVYMPIQATIQALVFFDITYAFYKTFRLKNKEAIILFLAATLTVLGNAPMTAKFLPVAVTLRDWLIEIPVGAGARAFRIMTAIGLIAFSIRALLKHEKVIIGVTE